MRYQIKAATLRDCQTLNLRGSAPNLGPPQRSAATRRGWYSPCHDEKGRTISRRKRVWIAIASVTAGALVVGLLALLLPDNSEHTRKYLAQVQVDPAYRQVGWGGGANCECFLEPIYIGPSHIEPAQVFSGPALTLRPDHGSFQVWDWLLKGEGASQASGRCSVTVSRYQRDREPYYRWKLSADERALVTSGRLALLQLWVGCERDRH
ncbi:hypothetical protein ACIBBG_12875 [Micromonospora chersina]|uniref:hypothetical protein n=1 Tax=Micromonospora chersina TaxID=47854 RepID=UPI003792E99F